MNWLWGRIKAMHWASKIFSIVFLVQAGVYLVHAYQLKHLQIPAFSELRRVEGKLILVKQRRDWLTGVEHPDGSMELFTCQPPGSGLRKLCFMSDVIEKYKLDAKPEVILWWYPLTAPLDGNVYPFIFQVQLLKESKPLSIKRKYGNPISYSFEDRSNQFNFLKTQGVRGEFGMAILYVLGVIFLFIWESHKHSVREE